MNNVHIIYTPTFLRALAKLPRPIQEEVYEKVELFKLRENHERLRVHKLKGSFKNKYSFSITYSHRVIFLFEDKNTAVFLAIGDHAVYD